MWLEAPLSPQESAPLELLCPWQTDRQAGRPAATTDCPARYWHICEILAVRRNSPCGQLLTSKLKGSDQVCSYMSQGCCCGVCWLMASCSYWLDKIGSHVTTLSGLWEAGLGTRPHPRRRGNLRSELCQSPCWSGSISFPRQSLRHRQ